MMEIRICKNSVELGSSAARYIAEVLNNCIEKKGVGRIILSTGASQFDTIAALVNEKVDWSCVEMFHLDEYVDLPETHKASFRKYLKDRFTNLVNLKAAHFVDGTKEGIEKLTMEIRKSPIDIGLIGIGENAHIAFNDPPADFDVKDAYITVNLNETCKKQQMGEGWFATIEDVPNQAVSMTVHQILQCERIVSCVPHCVKANAVAETLRKDIVNTIPSTILKTHKNFTLYIEKASAEQVVVNEILW